MEIFCCCVERGTERFGMMGLMRSGSFGSKRVSFSAIDSMDIDCYDSTPTKKKLCVKKEEPIFTSEQDKSPLESLPQDILIRVLCSVEHADLKNLIFVSKPISEAVLVLPNYFISFYVILSHVSQNLLLLKEQLNMIENEDIHALHDGVTSCLKKFNGQCTFWPLQNLVWNCGSRFST